MKTNNLLLVAAFACIFAISLNTAQAATQMLDFSAAPDFSYSGRNWSHTTPPPTITAVNGGADQMITYDTASETSPYWGSLFWTFAAPVDITGVANDTLEIQFTIHDATPGPQHGDTQLVFSLTDSDLGFASYEYQVDISGLTPDDDNIYTAYISRDAGTSYNVGGTPTTAPDFSRIQSFELWAGHVADVNTGIVTHDYNATLVNLAAVPEPHEYALIAGLGLVGFALCRRKLGSAV